MLLKIASIILITTFAACQAPQQKEPIQEIESTHIIPQHLQYAIYRIHDADFWDQGFYPSDSFYLWSWDDFGSNYNKNRITRTLNFDGYNYTFWEKSKDTFLAYNQIIVPRLQLINDTMYDVNGDKLKDLVISFNTNNSKCSRVQSHLFVLDSISKEFFYLKQVSEIPNAKFNPMKRTISSEVTCDCIKSHLELKWVDNFKLDTLKSITKNVCN